MAHCWQDIGSELAVVLGIAPFPGVIELPLGWQPEDIAAGAGNAFYVGAIPTGEIYRGDLRTGTGGIAVPPRPGRMAAGIKVDARERIFVAGAFTGQAYVYDGRTARRSPTTNSVRQARRWSTTSR